MNSKNDTNFELKKYTAIELAKNECEALEEIQKIGYGGKEIPLLSDPSEMKTGFLVENYHVVQLSFFEDELSIIPESIGNLTSLKHIAIVATPIKNLPESFGKLKSLETVFLSEDHQLTSLPDSFGDLYNLNDLLIVDTMISALPDSVGNLKSLKKITMQHNKKLTTLPESLGNLTSLKKVNFIGSPLSDDPGSIEKIFNKLEESGCKVVK